MSVAEGKKNREIREKERKKEREREREREREEEEEEEGLVAGEECLRESKSGSKCCML